MSALNLHGQPFNKNFNSKLNKEKIAFALRGILIGLTADSMLNKEELMFLTTWLSSQENIVTDSDIEGDANDLRHAIESILENKVISSEELDEMHELISTILEYGTQTSKTIENSVNELLGHLSGITADGVLNDDEFSHLDKWLIQNSHIADQWPANILIEQIKRIKQDGVISTIEKEQLLKSLKQISGQRFEETGAADGVAEIFSDEIGKFDHNNQKLCFTGKFIHGSRKTCEQTAKDKGAIISKRITEDTNVLIVGIDPSRDWRFTSYGRKIEAALAYRNRGKEILIISERTWKRYI